MPSTLLESESRVLIDQERIRPVMTTGLGSSVELIKIINSSEVSRIAGEIAVEKSNFIVGQPAVFGKSFLDLETGYKAEDALSDSLDISLDESFEEKLTSGFKREVFDFVNYLVEERDCDIDLDVVAERLAQTSNVFYSLQNKSTSGSYDAIRKETSILATVDSILTKDLLINVGIHEMTHAASGNIYFISEQFNPREPLNKQAKSIVIGLKRGNKFSWANEMITETIAQNIMHRSDPEYIIGSGSGYNVEMNLFSDINRVSGISVYEFMEAYFEEPDLHSKSGNRMPKWHKLQSKLTEAFGPKFLLKLEDAFKIDKPDTNYPYDSNKMKKYITPDNNGRTKIESMHDEWVIEKNKQLQIV